MRLILRCDGSATLGLGHVLRCVALADAARRRGHDVGFAVRPDPVALATVRRHGFSLVEVAEEPAHDPLGWTQGADWAVLDGYSLGESYCRRVQAAGPRVCAVDDLGIALPADLVVNPNLFASGMHTELGPRALCGPAYALLRPEFLEARSARAARERRGGDTGVRRVLVSFGGSDVAALTARTIDAVSALGLDQVETIAVIGPAHPDPESVRQAAARSRAKVQVVEASSSMGLLMAESDAAVSAAGTTALELLCVGVPSILVAVAANQARVGPAVAALKAGVDLGDVAAFDDARLGQALRRVLEPVESRLMAAAGRGAVDGRGPARVLEAMERRSH